MGWVTGQLVVKTLVKTLVCKNCQGLFIQGVQHCCSRRKSQQDGEGRIIVLGRRKTKVSVTFRQ